VRRPGLASLDAFNFPLLAVASFLLTSPVLTSRASVEASRFFGSAAYSFDNAEFFGIWIVKMKQLALLCENSRSDCAFQSAPKKYSNKHKKFL